MPSSYETWTVVASVLLAMFASFVALDLAKRVRTADRAIARAWLIGGSVTMGIGIWAMHFVGMMAFKLPISVGYDALYTLVSAMAAVGVSYMALWVASRNKLTCLRLTGGATAMGVGICAMHYLGMHAMEMDPGIVWDWRLVAASAGIAVGASAVALLIFFWLRNLQGLPALLWQITAAMVMGVAIAGMHYTGMAAAAFPLGTVCTSSSELRGDTLGVMVGAASMLLLSMTLLTSIMDARTQSRTNKLAASLQVANQELKHIAFKDPLTGLANRLVFEDQLDSAVLRAQEGNRRLGILFIDLDGFKPINDSFGHAVGDEVLKQVGQRLSQVARPGDVVARVGGDEFLMLLENHPDRATAAAVAMSVREALSKAFEVDGRGMHLSCSIGIVIHPDHGPRARLIANADAAMYAAKRAGGAVHCFYEADMANDAEMQIALQRDLRQSLDQGGKGLELYYQPKIHAQSRQTAAVEALIRWHHPTRGTVSPAQFIPVAERFGLIGALGDWVINDAFRQMRQWQKEGLRMRVAVNLSMHQLRQNDLVERVAKALREHKIEPDLVTFEVTESAAMEDTQTSLRMFDQLAALGVRLSIDDFGTGYSSLSYLRKLPARQLKIDRSFINDLKPEGDARAIVNAVVQLAHALGLHVVAEGVETAEQERILMEIGCDALQGFRYAKPMPAKRLAIWAASEEGPDHGAPMGFRDSLIEPEV
ncbi:MAG TPA: bifunctional diguanylate cyclase/phosphodiesterase [Candidatus Aquabacterium excrementipullorum]|nr:bifunctional diguanylate cyclase/phosphodiesterase [Candidatus Aquabacterium excrementipullorum]